jgi:pimeloyl-CoA dehydrogenase small subunit
MDFDLSEEQRLLKDSVDKLLAARYGDFEKRRAYQAEKSGFDPAVWREYAQSGLLALPFAEAHGGFGGGPVETMIVMEAFGRALAIEPYLPSVVLSGAILRHGASAALQDEFLPRIGAGEAIFALAQTERQSRHDLFDVATQARKDGSDYVIEGEKSVVLGGAAADHLIVSARVWGAARDRDGIGLFVVDAASPGVSRRSYPTQDGQRAAEISLGRVRVPASCAIGEPGAGLPILERAVDEAIAALCAEAVGAMDSLTGMTVDYLKTRKQFGVPIATFQALQHRAVDMLVQVEQARSMAILAAMVAAEPNAGASGAAARRRTISAAKVQIGRAARFVGQQAIQLHGGIGMTMEYKAGHYFKRLTMIDSTFGDADHHLRAVAAAGSLLAA